MINQHWFIGAVRQQAITWANVDPDLCRHMVSLGHNELTVIFGTQIRFQWQEWKTTYLTKLCRHISSLVKPFSDPSISISYFQLCSIQFKSFQFNFHLCVLLMATHLFTLIGFYLSNSTHLLYIESTSVPTTHVLHAEVSLCGVIWWSFWQWHHALTLWN